MPARYVMSLQWRRWSGPLSALLEAAEAAEAELQTWAQQKPLATVEVALPHVVMHLTAIRELEDLPGYDVVSLKTVRIVVTALLPREKGKDVLLPRHSVSFRLQGASPSMSVEVDGQDRVRVEGLTARLRETLAHANTGPSFRRDDIFLVPVAALLVLFVFLAVLPHVALSTLILPAVTILVATALGFWLLPGLEVLPPGQSSRYQRFRGFAIAVMIAVAASIVVAVGQNLLAKH